MAVRIFHPLREVRPRLVLTSGLLANASLGRRGCCSAGMREVVLQKDLAVNASRYEWNRARPEPEMLQVVWGTWMYAAAAAAFASSVIIVGILHSKKARENVFNLLIVFLCLPDFVFSFLCCITCAFSWSAERFSPIGGAMGCEWQSFYVMFGFTGSMWMQVVIAAELRHVLRCSHGRRVYVQPSLHLLGIAR